VVSSTPRLHFTPGNDPVPILQEAGWAPGSVGKGGKSRRHRDSIPDLSFRSSDAIPTELPGPHECVCARACVCVCSLSYPACNAHAPFCHLWPAPLYPIFSTSSHQRHDFPGGGGEGKIGGVEAWRARVKWHKMCVLISPTSSVWNISHSKKNWARYDQKCVLVII